MIYITNTELREDPTLPPEDPVVNLVTMPPEKFFLGIFEPAAKARRAERIAHGLVVLPTHPLRDSLATASALAGRGPADWTRVIR